MKIYRIAPPFVRSEKARDSWVGYKIDDVPWVRPDSEMTTSREVACSHSHARCLQRFLDSADERAIVIEDDAILQDAAWMGYELFDLFMPFASMWTNLAPNLTIVTSLPQFGTQAYITSRKAAEAWLPLLMTEISPPDWTHHKATKSMMVGSYVGNSIQHDLSVASLIQGQGGRM